MGIQLKMRWQPNLLSQKRKNGPPLGLKNLGNSCYLNSVLQCLTYTAPFANFCLKYHHSSLCDLNSDEERKRECPFCIVEKQIVRSLSLNLTLDVPYKVQSCLRIFAEHFRGGVQEDAHEFLRYVIDACHNTCLRLKKLGRKGVVENGNGNGGGKDSTIVKEIFGGALQSQVKCLSCGNESNKVDEIMDISLDILNSNSLKDALQKFFQPEILDGGNKYKCENCKKLVAAQKQMSLLQAPNIIVIQLKRFEGIHGGKIDRLINFEEFLVLSSFMCKESEDPEPKYNLFGTIVHSGFSPETGHYYAYIKDAFGRWYCCNDSYVSVSTLKEVLSEKVYILFYTRNSQRPHSNGSYVASNGVKLCESNGNGASRKVKPASNGVKSRECNGTEPSKTSKISLHLKTDTKENVERSFGTDISATSKVNNKISSSSRIRFSIVSTVKKVLRPGCEQSDSCENHGMNVNPKESIHLENDEKEKSPTTENGFGEHTKVNAVESNGVCNGVTQSLGPHDLSESNHMQKPEATIVPEAASLHQFRNGHMNYSGISVSKRKSQEAESCILFPHDANSHTELKELKENLVKEAWLVLRSCGWYDEVYKDMRSRKRLHLGENGDMSSVADLKKFLITDAKKTFISRIPETLKGGLIKRLQSTSQEK